VPGGRCVYGGHFAGDYRMRRITKALLIAGILVAGGLYGWKWQYGVNAVESIVGAGTKAEGKGKGGRRAAGPISVTVAVVERRTMPVVIDAVGTVESEHSVAVRAQISGVLEAVLFKEGDRVKHGQVLFRIDPRPAQAAVEQASAAVARDQAQLAQAQAQEGRLRSLVDKDYITRNEYDVATTQTKALNATLAANKAALEQARLQLSYTQISAPLSGRTGNLNVKPGNLVNAGGGGAPLVIINSTQPILVSLSVPQRHLDEVRQNWNSPDLKVELRANPSGPVMATGSLVFIDNTVNTQAGTILLKARVKNEKEELWPGQFVAARIVLRMEKDAVVLPESAVQPGQERRFVYIVRDGKAVMQEVDVARQVNDLVVIGRGLSGGEQVIAEVPPLLAPGSAVRVVDAAPRAAAQSASGAARQGPH
jgi:multidrug efflux system membrane fusion protein